MKTRNLLTLMLAVAAPAITGLCASDANAGKASGFAVVDSTGALVRGKSAIGASRSGIGTYSVVFVKSVAKCVYTASTGSTGNKLAPPNGFVTVAGVGDDPSGVFVSTFDGAGAPADLAFHLNVRC